MLPPARSWLSDAAASRVFCRDTDAQTKNNPLLLVRLTLARPHNLIHVHKTAYHNAGVEQYFSQKKTVYENARITEAKRTRQTRNDSEIRNEHGADHRPYV